MQRTTSLLSFLSAILPALTLAAPTTTAKSTLDAKLHNLPNLRSLRSRQFGCTPLDQVGSAPSAVFTGCILSSSGADFTGDEFCTVQDGSTCVIDGSGGVLTDVCVLEFEECFVV